MEKLKPFENKLYGIAATENSTEFYHPLAPQIRDFWQIKKFVLPDYLQVKENPNEKKAAQDKQLKKDGQIA